MTEHNLLAARVRTMLNLAYGVGEGKMWITNYEKPMVAFIIVELERMAATLDWQEANPSDFYGDEKVADGYNVKLVEDKKAITDYIRNVTKQPK